MWFLYPYSLVLFHCIGAIMWLLHCQWSNPDMGKINLYQITKTLQWRHNEHNGVLFAQPFIQARPKKTSTLHVIGLCEGNSPVNGEFPAQRASNAENVSIWWRHRGVRSTCTKSHKTPKTYTMSIINGMYPIYLDDLWPLLLTWFNFNPSMDK